MKHAFFSLIATSATAVSLMATPQAIIFDFGGVLTGEPNRQAVVRYICDTLNLSDAEFEQANIAKRAAVKQGSTDEAFWRGFAQQRNVTFSPQWGDGFKAALNEAIGINNSMYQLVAQLKTQGFPVGLLSNIDDRLAGMIRSCGLYAPFDPCILSYEIGVEKPNLGAYEILVQRLSLPAGAICFIDDLAENVAAAKEYGLDAIRFESEEQLRAALAQRGIGGVL